LGAVGTFRFTDQDDADDAVLFTEKTDEWPRVLADFNDAAHTMGLHTSWAKTTLQNIGSGPQPSPVDIHGNTVESTDCFTYWAVNYAHLAVLSLRYLEGLALPRV